MNTPPPLTLKNSGLATASLVLGILSLVLMILCLGTLFAIPAVICGHIALGRIKRSGGMLGGSGLAIAGLVTGYISLALIPFFAAIAIPNFVKARDTAQRNACINNLHIIDGAKQQWALQNNKLGDAVPTAEDLDRYIPGGFAHLHCAKGGEYTIGNVSDAPTCSIPGHALEQSQSYMPAKSRVPEFAPSNNLSSNRSVVEAQKRTALTINQCHLNLLTIEAAKRLWASRYQKQPTDVPGEDDLVPLLPDRKFPTCPEGGTYAIGAVGEHATCSIAEHQLSHRP